MEPSVLLLILIVIADVVLWVGGLVAPLSSAGRFRVFTAATLLLLVIGGNLSGWGRTMALAGLAVWLAAIIGGRLPGSSLQRA